MSPDPGVPEARTDATAVRRKGASLAAREHAAYVADARKVLLWTSVGMIVLSLFLGLSVGMHLYDYRTLVHGGSQDADLAEVHSRVIFGAAASLLRFLAGAALFAAFHWAWWNPRAALRTSLWLYAAVFVVAMVLRVGAGELPLHRAQILDLVVFLALSRGARSARVEG